MPILVFNCGSSSIKHTLYDEGTESVLDHGLEERIKDYDAGLQAILSRVERLLPEGLASITAVGHRVVHGGRSFRQSCAAGPDVIEKIRSYNDLAPLHNPHNLKGIEFASKKLPDSVQVAVFDTAFHSRIPPEAHNYAIPLELAMRYRIRRYGFHGISHHFVHDRAAALCRRAGDGTLKVITCHLGNGCSVAAVRGGVCLDTSMGFTPLEGLVMGTRCGDLDPAIVHFLMSREGGGMSDEEVHDMLNRESGLKGLSGASHDVRDLIEGRSGGDERARLALSVFTHRLKKYIAAYHGVLGGADVLVFTAGIGENSPDIRRESLEGLDALGLVLDVERNLSARGRQAEITGEGSRVRIFVIPTDEDRMIFHETKRILGESGRGNREGGRKEE